MKVTVKDAVITTILFALFFISFWLFMAGSEMYGQETMEFKWIAQVFCISGLKALGALVVFVGGIALLKRESDAIDKRKCVIRITIPGLSRSPNRST